jgi:hypothetical protein
MKQLLFLGEEVPKEEEEQTRPRPRPRPRAGAGAGAGEVSKGRAGSRARVSKQGKCPYAVFLSFLFMRAGSQSPEPFVASSTTLTIAC